MARSDGTGERLLEGVQLGVEEVAPAAHDAQHRFFQLRTERRRVTGEIEERHLNVRHLGHDYR